VKLRLIVGILVVLQGVALAKRGDADDARDQAEARMHYAQGLTKYDLAEYDAAIAEFKRAYELTKEPGLLFNIAQAYRLKKDPEQALRFYETFLGLKPDAPNRPDAEAQIVKMRAAVQEAEAERRRLAEEEEQRKRAIAPAVVVVAPPPPPTPFRKTGRGRAVIALAVVGGAALIAGAALGGDALAERSAYDRGCDSGPCDGARFDTGRRAAIATDALISIGAAAALTAVIVAVTREKRRPLLLGMSF
jgi:tetratricopeptide (TPR) repeat protein